MIQVCLGALKIYIIYTYYNILVYRNILGFGWITILKWELYCLYIQPKLYIGILFTVYMYNYLLWIIFSSINGSYEVSASDSRSGTVILTGKNSTMVNAETSTENMPSQSVEQLKQLLSNQLEYYFSR